MNIDFSVQAIPDGVWEGAEDGDRTEWCRLSLLVTPAAGDAAPVESFPKAVIDHVLLTADWRFDGEPLREEALASIRVRIPTADGFRWDSLGALRESSSSPHVSLWHERAVAEWTRIFNPRDGADSNVSFWGLVDFLNRQADGPELVKAMTGAQGIEALRIEAKQWEGLGKLADFAAFMTHDLLAENDRDRGAAGPGARTRVTTNSDPFLDGIARLFWARAFEPEDDLEAEARPLRGIDRPMSPDFVEEVKKEVIDSRNLAKARRTRVSELMAATGRAYETMKQATEGGLSRRAKDELQGILDRYKKMVDDTRLAERAWTNLGMGALSSDEIRTELDSILRKAPNPDFHARVHRELARAELASRNSAPPTSGYFAPDGGPGCGTDAEPIAARLSAIAALPRLAQYLGLLIDVDIPSSQIARRRAKGISVSVPTAKYETTTLYEKSKDFFGPSSMAAYLELADRVSGGTPQRDPERKSDEPLYRHGFVNLRRRNDNFTDRRYPRFVLRQTADELLVRGTTQWLSEFRDEVAHRERGDRISREPPVGMTPGVTLVDTQVADQLTTSAMIATVLGDAAAGGADDTCLTLETLAAGMRFDIGMVEDPFRATGDTAIEWFAACGRSLRFDVGYEDWLDDSRLLDDNPIAPRATDRDEAVIMTVLELKSDAVDGDNGQPAVSAAVRAELQTYAGRPLGLPAKPQTLQVGACDGLVLNQTLAPPDPQNLAIGDRASAPSRFPALRFGRGYLMSARIAYENHGGLSWRDAYRRYYSQATTLAKANELLYLAGAETRDENDERVLPLILRRNEPVAPPKPLLFDRLSRRPDFQADEEDEADTLDSSENAGAQMRVVIHRNEDGAAQEAMRRRVLAPPRVSREFALLHDCFRNYRGSAPPNGAFGSLRLHPEHGDFVTTGDEDGAAEGAEPMHGDSIARPVFRVGERQPQYPYYPDPLAQLLCVMLVPVDAPMPQEERDNPFAAVPFYPDDAEAPHLDEALAHLVEVMPAAATRPRIVVDSWRRRPAKWRRAVDKRIRVELPAGRDYDLVYWSAPWEAMAGNPSARARVLRVGHEGESSETRTRQLLGGARQGIRSVDGVLPALEARLSDTGKPVAVPLPIGRSIPSERLRVIHSSARPTRAPEFRDDLRLVRVALPDELADDGSAAGDPIDEVWAEYVQRQGTLPTPDAWQSERGGQPALLAGSVWVDRASTASVSVWAEWMEPPRSATRVQGDDEGSAPRYECSPTIRRERLARVDALPRPSALNPPEDEGLFLLQRTVDGSEIVARAYDFDDQRARKLTLILSASSRFRAHYPGLDQEPADKARPWETPFSVPSTEKRDVLLPATRRPSAPKIERVTASASIAAPKRIGRDTLVLHKRWGVRVWLGTEWYSSGIGEMLAVICRPETLFSDAPDLFADRNLPSTLARYVTVWGADPIVASGVLPRIIPPWRFIGADGTVSEVELPVPVRTVSDTETLQRHLVSASLHQPQCDPETGEFFCDLVLDASESYAPMVRFGLARHNGNSLKNLEMSTPAEREIVHPIKPGRTVRVTRRHGDDADGSVYFDVVVDGVGYWNKDAAVDGEGADRMKYPHMRLRFFETASPTSSGRLVPAEFRSDPEPVVGERTVGPSLGTRRGARGGPMTWTFETAKLPRTPAEGTHYMLFLEEIGSYSADGSNPETSQRTDLSEEKIRMDLILDGNP